METWLASTSLLGLVSTSTSTETAWPLSKAGDELKFMDSEIYRKLTLLWSTEYFKPPKMLQVTESLEQGEDNHPEIHPEITSFPLQDCAGTAIGD